MEAKLVVFLLIIFVGVPVSVIFMRASRNLQKWAMFATVFTMPFFYFAGVGFGHIDRFYRGTSVGFEISSSHIFAFCILLFLILSMGKKFVFFPPGSRFYLFYFLMSAISMVNAEELIFSYYELFKMFLMYLYFIAVYNWIIKYRNLDVIFNAFASVILLNFLVMLFQHYILRQYQCTGLFIHQNSTAIFANIVSPLFLAYVLNVKLSRGKFWLFMSIYASAAITIVFTLSRGALFFFPISAIIVTFFSLLNGLEPRKTKIVLLLCLFAFLALLKAVPMIIDRFENAPKTSGETRVHFARCALNMADDKFFGVGLNNWGLKINPPYTYHVGTGLIRNNPNEKAGIVETIYLLVAAECGWIGLVSLLGWFGYYYIQCFFNMRRYRNSAYFFMPVGIFAGLSAAFGQSVLEWVLKQPITSLQLMLLFAVIAAMYSIYNNSSAKRILKKEHNKLREGPII